MKPSLSRQIVQPQLGPFGPAQIIEGPCPKGQAHLNGLCRDIPNAGLTKCGVVKIEYNDYMMFENQAAYVENNNPSNPQTVDPENINRRRRRAINGRPNLTRIIGGADSTINRWPWQVSITKNETIPDPIIKTGNNGWDIIFLVQSLADFF